jgi:tyrosyl-tRNA synthetase
MNLKSKFLQEFFDRGYLAQCTDIESLDNILATKKISTYIGFDCTAQSLHAGSLIQIMILRLLQKHQHKPIILLGAGTTKIGDPSGKDEARQVLNDQIILKNLTGIKTTLEKFVSFNGDNSAILVNNDQWLNNINYLEFLRDIGRHFSINRMLTFDSVNTRLQRQQPLSFLEFNYMILQAYDFVELRKKYNCILQIGGSDQWGNIINGVELWRRLNAVENLDNSADSIAQKEIFGLTSQLLTTSDGKKMGKTANGAVWLDSSMLSPFDYFQYFRNTSDQDVIKFLKLFTDLELLQIAQFENLSAQELNPIKEILAFETTKICHGEEIAKDVLQKSREIFLNKNIQAFEHKIINCQGESKKLVEIIIEINAAASRSDAKRLIEGKAVKVNDKLIEDINLVFNSNQQIEIVIGKKKHFRITLN